MSDNLEKELKRLRDERQQKFNEEDWEGALKIHDKILELSPSALRYANRGSILYRLGRLKDAIESYQKALEMEPTLSRAKADLERLEAQLQQQPAGGTGLPSATVDAEEKYEPVGVDDLAPGDKSLKMKQIEDLRKRREEATKKENWAEALQLHNQILEMEPSAFRYVNQGSILYRMGKIKEAIESYKKALQLDPNLEKAKVDLQKLQTYLDSQAEEEKLLQDNKKEENKALQQQVENFRKARQQKIEAGDWEGALLEHDKIMKLDPTALRYANRGAMLYQMGKIEEACQNYQKALELDPTLSKAKEDLQRLEAQREEEKLIAFEPQDAQAYTTSALSAEERTKKITELRDLRQKYLDEKEWDKALALHDEIILIEPTALRYVNRGSMLYRMKRLEDAIESYRKAIEMDPNLGRAKMDLERMEKELAQQGKKGSAKAEPSAAEKEKQAKAQLAEKLEFYRQQRQSLMEQNRLEEALAAQDKIIELEPTAARYASRGSLLYSLGQVNEAILSYRKALDLDNSYQKAQDDLKKLQDSEMERLRLDRQKWMEEEKWEEALAVHDVILALDPTGLRYANRGSILYRMNRLADAIAAYQKALELDPNLPKAKEDIAELQEEMKKVEALSPDLEEEEDFQMEELDDTDTQATKEPFPEDTEKAKESSLQRNSVFTLSGHQGDITDLVVSLDGKIMVSASKDKTLRVWDSRNKACIHILQGHQDWVRSIALSPDASRIISGSDDWTAKIWNVAQGKLETTLEGHTMPLTAVAVQGKGRFFFSASRDHSIKVWDAQTYKCTTTLLDHKDWVTALLASVDGNKIVSASSDKTMRVWHLLGWRCLATLEGSKSPIGKILLSPDGNKIFSLSQDRLLSIWEGTSGKLLFKCEGHKGEATDISLSRDGKVLASCGRDQTIRLWNAENGKEIQTFTSNQTGFSKVLLSDDQRLVFAAGDDHTIYVWKRENAEQVASWEEHKAPISTLVLSPENKWVLSGSRDATIKIWDYASL